MVVGKSANAAVQSFTSWKLDIIDAMISDPRVTHSDFRIAFRIMQAVNADSRIAIISDLTLSDEVPKTDRFDCNETRKRLERLGWWTVERGHGGKASRYLFSPENINAVLDQRTLDKEARDEVRAERKTRDRRRKGRGTRTTLIPSRDVVPIPRGRGARTTGTPSLSPSGLGYEEEETNEDRVLRILIEERLGTDRASGRRAPPTERCS